MCQLATPPFLPKYNLRSNGCQRCLFLQKNIRVPSTWRPTSQELGQGHNAKILSRGEVKCWNKVLIRIHVVGLSKYGHDRYFMAEHVPQIHYKNQPVQILPIKDTTGFPHIKVFFEDGKDVRELQLTWVGHVMMCNCVINIRLR